MKNFPYRIENIKIHKATSVNKKSNDSMEYHFENTR